MKELKTLKDLKTAEQSNYFPIEAHQSPSESKIWGEAVLVEDLKQEAIKWVKKYERAGWLRSAEDFKRFFNLTEEDLK
jgi:guanyl-specific ribonuclease Sa